MINVGRLLSHAVTSIFVGSSSELHRVTVATKGNLTPHMVDHRLLNATLHDGSSIGCSAARTVIRESKVDHLFIIFIELLFMDIVLRELSSVQGPVPQSWVHRTHLSTIQLYSLGLLQ